MKISPKCSLDSSAVLVKLLHNEVCVVLKSIDLVMLKQNVRQNHHQHALICPSYHNHYRHINSYVCARAIVVGASLSRHDVIVD